VTNVKIARKTAAIVSSTDTQIVVTIPNAASGTSGTVTVTTPNGSDFMGTFTFP
jgi:hypothetical protein